MPVRKQPASVARDLLGNEVDLRARLTRDEIAQLLRGSLKGRSSHDIAWMLTNPARNAFEYVALRNGDKTCQRMSLLYNPHRLEVRSHQDKNKQQIRPSIYDAMQTDKFYDGLARAFLGMYSSKARQADIFYQMIQIGIQGSVYINEFPPHVARDIYHEFKLDRKSRILDPCAGWGGRMIGASVVSDHYDGCEPSSRTFVGLEHLAKDLNGMTNGAFIGRVSPRPFEDATIAHNKYDFALTSPPYYDTEIYSDEETNSLNRYKTFDDWVIGFYLPFIDKTMSALKPTGAFVLNIGDRKYPLPAVMREHAQRMGYSVRKLPSRLAHGGGLRDTSNEGEVFFILTKEETT